MNKKLVYLEENNGVKKEEHVRIMKELDGKYEQRLKQLESDKSGLREKLEELAKEQDSASERVSRDSKFKEEEKKLLVKQVGDLNAAIQRQKNEQMQAKMGFEEQTEALTQKFNQSMKELNCKYNELRNAFKDNEEELKSIRITNQKNTAVSQQNI